MTLEAGGTPDSREAEKLTAASMAGDAGFLLAKLHAVGSVLNNRALAEHGLKERSFPVLALANSDLEPTQREMAEFLSLDPSQIVSLVDALEERGLVERAADLRDRRSKVIRPTPAGRKLYGRAAAAVRDAEETSLAALDGAERDQLRILLRKIAFG